MTPMNTNSQTQPSVSVGDYLKSVWEVAGTGAASTKDVAERLSVSAASVSNMFVRLQEMGLVRHERYHGASLTERGKREAMRLVRRHRLIETFLLEHLGYSWDEVHEEAERLEHAVSDTFTERLAEYLGHPAHDPHGDPIPTPEGMLEPDRNKPLRDVEEGEEVRVSRVDQRDEAVLAYLGEQGLVPGTAIRVLEVRGVDGVVTVEGEDGSVHTLGEPLTRSIFVRADS